MSLLFFSFIVAIIPLIMVDRNACVGAYERLPLAVSIDSACAYSRLSSDFVLRHNLPRTVRVLPTGVAVSSVAGAFSIPTQSGHYISCFHVEVALFGHATCYSGLIVLRHVVPPLTVVFVILLVHWRRGMLGVTAPHFL